MAKCSLTIHGLKQHTASRMGQLTDFLCKEFELSEELIQARLQRFPVTFKNWVEAEKVPALQAAFDRLETMVEFSTPDGMPVKHGSAEILPPEDAAVPTPNLTASNELELPPDIAAALENSSLAWDDAAPTTHVEPTTRTEPQPAIVDAASPSPDLSLSFDEPESAQVESFLDKLETMDLVDTPSTLEPVEKSADAFALAPDPLPPPKPTKQTPPSLPTIHPAIAGHKEEASQADGPSLSVADSHTINTTTPKETAHEPPDNAAVESTTHHNPRPETPEVLIGATKPSHPKQFDEFVPEEEIHGGPSLLHLIIGVVIIGGGAAGYLFLSASEQAASPILISNVDKLLAQQGEILNPTDAQSSAAPTLTKTREIPQDLGRWTGDSAANGITTKATAQVSASKGLWELHLEVETPPPPKLTAQEIVNKTPAHPWISRIETSELALTFDPPEKSASNSKSISFQFEDVAKVYLRSGAKAERLTGALTGRGVFNVESNEILGEWSVKAGQTLPPNSQKAQREADGSLSFAYSGPFVARPLPNKVNSGTK